MTNESFDMIRTAIVEQAVKDYVTSLWGKKIDTRRPQDVIEEIRLFFKSQWCQALVDIAPDVLERGCYAKYLNEIDQKIEYHKKEIKRLNKRKEKALETLDGES